MRTSVMSFLVTHLGVHVANSHIKYELSANGNPKENSFEIEHWENEGNH